MTYSRQSINIDPQKETAKICNRLKIDVFKKLKRRGAVIGISGGIDSSVVLALCVKAFGPQKVIGIIMPEKDSSPENFPMVQKLVDKFEVQTVVEDMTPALYGFETYKRRDEAIQRIFPEYNMGYKTKIGLSQNILEKDTLNLFSLTIISPDGEQKTKRMPLSEYLQIVAASNFKQRSRMSMLYYHAERQNYAVIGTANKNEHALGFFVKYGDGGADVMPISHLFKTQIFQLAEHLDIPEEIRSRTPTTDTYSAEQTQEEFFFRLPFDILDRIWHGWENGYSTEEIASALDLGAEQVQNVINDIKRKMQATEYLRMPPL
ncbi:NAD(+) synthase [candidate division KSB1 bacterium]|nr:NAD(+) synthase [candidate division KSB1 bacterium]